MIHRRHLQREVIAASLLILAGFIALFGFFDLLGELRDVGKGSYRLTQAVLYTLLILPGRVYELMPVAVLIGTLYALSTLARHSEITVLRASGLSTWKLLLILFRAAGWFALAAFLIGEFVAPAAEQAAQTLRVKSISGVVAQDFRSGLWVKDGPSFVNVKQVMPDGTLRGVRIYRFDADLNLLAVSDAAHGEHLDGANEEANWRLNEVVSTRFSNGRASVEKLPSMLWRSALSPEILAVLLIKPDRMSVMSLVTYIRHQAENGLRTDQYQIALWKKLAYPFASLVMVALALPFGYTHSRVSGVALKLFGGVMLGVFFHMLNGLFSSLGVINSWSPLASAFAPAILFMLAAAGMLWWVERR